MLFRQNVGESVVGHWYAITVKRSRAPFRMKSVEHRRLLKPGPGLNGYSQASRLARELMLGGGSGALDIHCCCLHHSCNPTPTTCLYPSTTSPLSPPSLIYQHAVCPTPTPEYLAMSGNAPSANSAAPPPQAIKRLKMLDADGDSTMHSSPELGADNEMFPDEGAGPSTPRNAANFALDPSSELSPPNSQGPSNLPRDDSFTAAFSGSPSLNVNGKRVLAPTSAGAHDNAHMDSETGYSWSRQEDQPGWEWKNTRAREDEARALEQIVDKNSMIRSRCMTVLNMGRY